MIFIPKPNYIECCFDPGAESISRLYKGALDIYYADIKIFSSLYPRLLKYISIEEQLRAVKFHFDRDRETYIASHAILRIVLSKYLGVKPLEVAYIHNNNNKPGIAGKGLNFNLSRSRDAFAFAVSNNFYVGIDLEYINNSFNIDSIVESFFSQKEYEFIYKSKIETKSRFFLLWTRKESLLKALGTGIIENLSKIEVSGKENIISRNSFDKLNLDYDYHSLFLHSKKIRNSYLSIAVPQKVSINFHYLDYESIDSFLV